MKEWNKYQSTPDKLNLEEYPKEIQEQFWEFIGSVPYIQALVDKDRPRAKDLPRDAQGRIIVDITKPHILEDMDYFRPSALCYEKTGKYTELRPNANPNSAFGKWVREEVRRCIEGYVRESDGEWVTGDYYYFLNYAPMSLSKKVGRSNMAQRVIGLPTVWEGHYYKFHYIYQARMSGHHAAELASRSKGKSFVGASLLTKRFILGESWDVCEKVTCYITADDKKYLVAGDQTLDKFQYNIDWIVKHQELQFPMRRIKNSLSDMQWIAGYKDVDTGAEMGSQNAVIGVTSKDDESKLRGTRGVLYVIEEWGTFPKLLDLYNNLRPSVEEGDLVFGQIIAYGTSGDKNSDFSAAQEIMYNPLGYNMHALPNVYDKTGQGKKLFVFFFPGYLNRAECYDENGNSDVTKALLQILKDRHTVKYNSTDINSITKRVAEIPITPQEAIRKTKGNMFPVNDLLERVNQIDNDESIMNGTWVGTLVFNAKNEVEFRPTADTPIRNFPLKDNKAEGAIEIFEMPEKDRDGKVYRNRYILGHDPVDDDEANTMSLTSTFVMDLWTDRIVAEYTGRQSLADSNFEIVRKLCLFYNGKCMYEQNKKGIFSYFSRMNCLYLLAETPEYLKDKEIIKQIGTGNKSRGINATLPVNNYANELIKNWLIKPIPVNRTIDGEVVESSMPQLYFVKNRALLQELIAFNPFINVDRVRALGMLMLYREEKMILYGGDIKGGQEKEDVNPLAEDDFFQNFDKMLARRNKQHWSK